MPASATFRLNGEVLLMFMVPGGARPCLCGFVLHGLVWTLFVFGLVEARSGFAQEEPTHAEQLAIYDLNVARADPPAYARSVGLGDLLDGVGPRPPLALNRYLVDSARFRAREMAMFDYFEHQSEVTGDWPNRVVRDHGYPLDPTWPSNANHLESIAAGFRSFQAALFALIEDVGFDPPGHRIHLLGLERFWLDQREIGVGHAFRASSTFGHYFAYHTGKRAANRPFLTGVVYDDRNANNRYDYNEGLGGVTVRVRGATSADVTTMRAGGWAVRTDRPGTHFVEVSGGPFVGEASTVVTVRDDNIALDFISGQSQPQVNFEDVPTGAGTTVRLSGRRNTSSSSSCGTPTASSQGKGNPTAHKLLGTALVAILLLTTRARMIRHPRRRQCT